MFRIAEEVGFPEMFLRKIVEDPAPGKKIIEYCGESIVFSDGHKLIIERGGAYYLDLKSTTKKMTNWVAEDVSMCPDGSMGVYINNDRITLTTDEIPSPYRIRKKFAKQGYFIFLKSESSMYALIESLINKGKKRKAGTIKTNYFSSQIKIKKKVL